YPLSMLFAYGLLAGLCALPGLCKSVRSHNLWLWLFGAFFCIYGTVNHYKLLFRLEPLFLTDITLFRDAMEVATLGFGINWVVIGATIAALIAALVWLLCKRHEPVRRSWLLPVLGCLLMVWLVSICKFSLLSRNQATDMNEQAQKNGSLFTMIAMDKYRTSLMNIDYQQEEVEKAYTQLMKSVPESNPEAVKPNIIFVLAESFTDEAILGKHLNLTKPLMPYYQSLMEECRRGLLYVPKAGGGTSESEFEVLSALRSKYTLNPYSIGLPPIRSTADILTDKGYHATALHWHVGVFYNRYNNLRMQGFDSFHTLDTSCYPYERIGSYVTDEAHFDSVMEHLRLTDEQDFLFCLTMQNHGGYTYFDFREKYGASTPFTNQFSPATEKVAANFCYLLTETDQALQKWIEELRNFDEPTVVVFFSDHLAPLGTDVLAEIGLPITGDEAHWVPYFIWSNYGGIQPGKIDLHAYQLSPYVLTELGLCDDPFFAYVESLRKAGISSDETYDLLSYDALFGEQYAYQLGGYSPVNPAYQVGGSMEITGIEALATGEQLCIRPRLGSLYQAYTLLVDGKPVRGNIIPASDRPFTLSCVMQDASGKEYNRSQTLHFDSTDQLLTQAQPISCQTLPLDGLTYFHVKSNAAKATTTWATKEPIGQWAHTALSSQSGFWQQIATERISKPLEYRIDNEGRLWVTIPNAAMPKLTTANVQKYLKEQQAMLHLLDCAVQP
ncbi:MAG: LTA synthase family protein, partial [Clostridia bacterium]|nr:LTA synthase family protein [Clostridia bacterium]